MKHSLGLEFIAENRHFELSMHKKHGLQPPKTLFRPMIPQRPWVAEIVGIDSRMGFERVFLRGVKDYSQSNGSASRGVYLYFYLDDGKIYEVHSPRNWKKFDRYFVRYNGYEKQMLSREEVLRCLSAHSA